MGEEVRYPILCAQNLEVITLVSASGGCFQKQGLCALSGISLSALPGTLLTSVLE